MKGMVMHGSSKGLRALKGSKTLKSHKVTKRNRARVAPAARPSEVVVVSSAQYKRLTGPDRPNEVPSALRELVLKNRSSTATR